MDPKHTILIVDDERENLNLLENVLGGDYSILRASDGPSALDVLQKHPVDMVVTDQRMPGLKGGPLLERVRELKPDIVRILITAYPDITVAVDAINRGQIKRYVSKPFDPDELRTIVRQELEVYELARANRRLTGELGRAVDDLSAINRRLQDLDRLKDSFLANISHELRTPLVSSIGYIDLMLGGGLGSVNASMEKGLRVAQRNLNRLLSLIQDLLTLARLKRRPQEAFPRTSFSLRGLIDECVQSLKARSRKEKLDVRVRVPARLPPVHADEKGVHSVLTNVLANAEKFTPARARIEITVKRRPNGRCRVQVRDNGIGPAGAHITKDFPSFNVDEEAMSRRYGGLGIGLALAQQIVEMHGGSITLEPASRGGALVTFDLPFAPRSRSR